MNDGDLVETLIRTAGRRAVPPDELRERAFAAASAALERKLGARRRRQVGLQWAAGVLLAIGMSALLVNLQVTRRADVANVERIVGSAEFKPSGATDWRPLTLETAVEEGTRLRTVARSRAGLLLPDRTSLRLAERTEIEFRAGRTVALVAGKVYVDTGAADAGNTITLITPAGVTRDIGTTFELRFREHEYRLRVRDGIVLLQREGLAMESSAGEQLTIDAAGSVARAAFAPHGPAWRWAEQLAPRPDVDGRPLSGLLDWVAQETGRRIDYATPELADRVQLTVLHGHIGTLAPMDALAVMLATTDFEHVLRDDGTILIRPREHTPRSP